MASETESTDLLSTGNEHIDKVMTALKNNDAKADALKPYLTVARWIPLAINPYANITSVFFTGMEQDAEDEDVTQSSEIDNEEEKRIFTDIMKLVPTFKDLLTACCGHRRALLNLIRMLQDSANGARNDDIAKTNSCIVDYHQPAPSTILQYNKREYPLPTRNRNEERGWAHPEYGVLLIPLVLIDSFSPEDFENTMHDAEMGLLDISECEWPSFLYPLGSQSDETNDRLNLFRGYLLPIVFRQIFTGPRTAMDPGAAKKGRPSKSRLHNMTEVTPRTIAYTCLITRIALRGRGWVLADGAFEHGVFYQNIVRMFESNPDDPWVKETLAWWNEQIPDLPKSAAGTSKRPKRNMTGIDGRIMDPVARSAAQRASANARVASPLPSEEWNQSDSMLEDEPMAAEDEGHASLLRAQPTPALVPRASPSTPLASTRQEHQVAANDNDSDLSDPPESPRQDQFTQLHPPSSATPKPTNKRPSATAIKAAEKRRKNTESRVGPAKKSRRTN